MIKDILKKLLKLFCCKRDRLVQYENVIFTEKTAKQLKELEHREIKCDEDTPEIINWEKAQVGRFYRPVNNKYH